MLPFWETVTVSGTLFWSINLDEASLCLSRVLFCFVLFRLKTLNTRQRDEHIVKFIWFFMSHGAVRGFLYCYEKKEKLVSCLL